MDLSELDDDIDCLDFIQLVKPDLPLGKIITSQEQQNECSALLGDKKPDQNNNNVELLCKTVQTTPQQMCIANKVSMFFLSSKPLLLLYATCITDFTKIFQTLLDIWTSDYYTFTGPNCILPDRRIITQKCSTNLFMFTDLKY